MADIFHGKCFVSPALGGGNSLLFEYLIIGPLKGWKSSNIWEQR